MGPTPNRQWGVRPKPQISDVLDDLVTLETKLANISKLVNPEMKEQFLGCMEILTRIERKLARIETDGQNY
jgi:hypothetical protein